MDLGDQSPPAYFDGKWIRVNLWFVVIFFLLLDVTMSLLMPSCPIGEDCGTQEIKRLYFYPTSGALAVLLTALAWPISCNLKNPPSPSTEVWLRIQRIAKGGISLAYILLFSYTCLLIYGGALNPNLQGDVLRENALMAGERAGRFCVFLIFFMGFERLLKRLPKCRDTACAVLRPVIFLFRVAAVIWFAYVGIGYADSLNAHAHGKRSALEIEPLPMYMKYPQGLSSFVSFVMTVSHGSRYIAPPAVDAEFKTYTATFNVISNTLAFLGICAVFLVSATEKRPWRMWLAPVMLIAVIYIGSIAVTLQGQRLAY